jgi:hypothetical protein
VQDSIRASREEMAPAAAALVKVAVALVKAAVVVIRLVEMSTVFGGKTER